MRRFFFVGALGKMEMEKVPQAGFKIIGLPIVGIQRKLTLKNLIVPFQDHFKYD
jgi:UDP-N-acetylglucosamine--N-acetylmuramyl-(pentapeptide) pyrophosphoryl-undecaprenol N-acetylglucosamine transferase